MDVRKSVQFEIYSLPGSVNVPLYRLKEASPPFVQSAQCIVAICRRGVDSKAATALLLERGHKDVWSLEGGLEAWRAKIDPNVPQY